MAKTLTCLYLPPVREDNLIHHKYLLQGETHTHTLLMAHIYTHRHTHFPREQAPRSEEYKVRYSSLVTSPFLCHFLQRLRLVTAYATLRFQRLFTIFLLFFSLWQTQLENTSRPCLNKSQSTRLHTIATIILHCSFHSLFLLTDFTNSECFHIVDIGKDKLR